MDRFGITDPDTLLLLIEYVTEMDTTCDYGSLDNISRILST